MCIRDRYTGAVEIFKAKKTKMGRTYPDETSTPSPNLGIDIIRTFTIIFSITNQRYH